MASFNEENVNFCGTRATEKSEKFKGDKQTGSDNNREKNKDLIYWNEEELKNLLEEAVTYKNPKDREGKSLMFKELLSTAEENERKDRAARAGGSELVRHYNTTAKRSKNRRKQYSVSETIMQGGSLDNLAKEELFIVNSLNRTKRTVSTRQNVGGSLPSNVDSGGVTPHYECQFLDEARRKKDMRENDYRSIDMETVSLLKHDSLAESYSDQLLQHVDKVPPIPQKFTTKATLQINVDDALHIPDLDLERRGGFNTDGLLSAKLSQCGGSTSTYVTNHLSNQRKYDENGNALHQSSHGGKAKKKKLTADKNVVVKSAELVEGHRSDIINDLNKLLEYIGETHDSKRSSNVHKSKQLHKHSSEENKSKKQRAQSSKGKENRPHLKKCNSLGEICSTKLEEFDFSNKEDDNSEKVVLRTKSTGDKSRERRSWGNVEPPGVIHNLYKNPSLENLETSDFRVVTKKKKTKKRRSSVGSSCRKSHNSVTNNKHSPSREVSPDPRRKSICSVPHSEKSNDSSDIDSIHSLPIDSERMNTSLNIEDSLSGPISYADIAKTSEKVREKKISSASDKCSSSSSEKATPPKDGKFGFIFPSSFALEFEPSTIKTNPTSNVCQHVASENQNEKLLAMQNLIIKNNVPPDFDNIKSFPAIQNNKVGFTKLNSEKMNARNTSHIKMKDTISSKNNKNMSQGYSHLEKDSKNELHSSRATSTKDIDTIHCNAKVMPLNIPDCRSIEKLHFINHQGGKLPPHLQSSSHSANCNNTCNSSLNCYTSTGSTKKLDSMKPLKEAAGNDIDPVISNMFASMNKVNSQKENVYKCNASTTTSDLSKNIDDENTTDQNSKHSAADNAVNVNTKTLFSDKNIQCDNVIDSDSNVVVPVFVNLKNNKCDEELSVIEETAVAAATYSAVAGVGVKSSSSDDKVAFLNCNFDKDICVPNGSIMEEVLEEEEGEEEDDEAEEEVGMSAAANCDNCGECSTNNENDSSSRPPVVILSGSDNKEVAGLVFGFDVNEQLLSEDVCENFISRFVVPNAYNCSFHNHDKIVSYIGSAWEETIRNQSSGQAQYYSEDL